jgi:hypothetical protein
MPGIHCGRIEDCKSLKADGGAATHLYSFWEGIELAGRMALGKLFKESSSCRVSAVSALCVWPVQHPDAKVGHGTPLHGNTYLVL